MVFLYHLSILNKVTKQGLKKSHPKTFVTIIGVVLSAAIITTIATFIVSLLNYMTNGSAKFSVSDTLSLAVMLLPTGLIYYHRDLVGNVIFPKEQTHPSLSPLRL